MKRRILIVDDDRLVADTLGLVFRLNGFETETRYSASEGLECALTYHPELMLLDITMPERNGLELAADVSQQLPECRILMLTAYTSNTAKASAQFSRLQRPVNLLYKPCRPEELLREASQLLAA